VVLLKAESCWSEASGGAAIDVELQFSTSAKFERLSLRS
jgi:hypothetical protein